ncbi:MAG: hypothetical protein LPK47_00565 [Bacteroidota bacterium]|nr:hypothetical protein [Bacteroidota bacterium]
MDKERDRMKHNPYSVPEGFFQQQRENILKATIQKEQDREPIPIWRNRKGRTLLFSTLAVAASVILIISLDPDRSNGTTLSSPLDDPDLMALEADPYWLLDEYGTAILPNEDLTTGQDSLLLWEIETDPFNMYYLENTNI